MKKNIASKLLLLSICFAMLLSLGLPAARAEEPGSRFSIIIEIRGENADGVAGAVMDLHRVAAQDADGNWIPASGFEGLVIGDDGKASAEEASAIVRDKSLQATQTATVTGTEARFPTSGESLDAGLYLVDPQPHVAGGYTYYVQPILVALPGIDPNTGEAFSTVRALPKFSRVPFQESEESVQAEVIVEWVDSGYETYRPDYVTVTLLRNDEPIGVARITPAGHWRYVWTGLHRETELGRQANRFTLGTLSAGSAAAAPIALDSWIDQEQRTEWRVEEDAVPHYTTTYSREGDTFLVVNTIKLDPTPSPSPSEKPSEEKPPIIPQTGQLWWPVLLLVVAGVLVILFGYLYDAEEERAKSPK